MGNGKFLKLKLKLFNLIYDYLQLTYLRSYKIDLVVIYI